MKMLQTQYNAIYTLVHNEIIYIRQFSKFVMDEQPDDILWYSSETGNTVIVTDEEEIAELEELFVNILE